MGMGCVLVCEHWALGSCYSVPSRYDLLQKSGSGPSKKPRPQEWAWVELLPGSITNPDDRHCDPDTHGDGDKNNDVE